jgi:7TM sweet-taste receptor of 3 GCPR
MYQKQMFRAKHTGRGHVGSLIFAALLFIVVLLTAVDRLSAQTIDNPTVIRIGTTQAPNGAPLGPIAEVFANQAVADFSYFEDFHVAKNGPFLINGNYYTFEIMVYDYNFDVSLMIEQYTEMYNNGIRAFISSTYTTLLGSIVPDLFNTFEEQPIFFKLNTDRDVIPQYPNVFSSAPSRIVGMSSSLDALAISGAKTVSCVHDLIDPVNSEFCIGAIQLSAERAMTAHSPYHTVTSDTIPQLNIDHDEFIEELTGVLELIRDDENPDVLIVAGYSLMANATMNILKNMNWLPKAVILAPFIFPYDTSLVQNAEYCLAVDIWNRDLNYPGDIYFGTPQQFAIDYQNELQRPPGLIDVMTISPPLLIQIAYTDAIQRFNIMDGGLPTMEQLQFAMERVTNQTFFGDIRFNIDGIIATPWVSAQLRGEGPLVNPMDPYSDLTIVSPLIARNAKLVYPMPTFDERVENTGYYNNTGEIVITVIAAVMIVYLAILIIMVVLNHKSDVIRYGQPMFMILSLIGFILITCSLFTWQIYVTTAGCVTTVWLVSLGIYSIVGSQIIRTYRVFRILAATQQLKRYTFTNFQAIGIFAAGLILVLPFLISVTARGGIEANTVSDLIRPINNYTECVAHSPTVELIALIAIFGMLIIMWMSIAGYSYSVIKTENDIFNEIVSTIACTILIAVCGVVLVVVQLVGLELDVIFYLRASIILLSSFVFGLSIMYKFTLLSVESMFTMGSGVGSSSYSENGSQNTPRFNIMNTPRGSQMSKA